MKILAIDPGTKQLGWCLYLNGYPVEDGLWESGHTDKKSPLSFMESFGEFLETMEVWSPDVVVTERTYNPSKTRGSILNVSVDMIGWWAKENGYEFDTIHTSTVKATARRLLSKKGRMTKDDMLGAAKPHLQGKWLKHKHGHNVADAHIIAQTYISKNE